MSIFKLKKKEMKKQLFYIFDEHTDFVKECIKKGMKPLSDEMFVEEFEFDGTKYQTLGVHDIYSGWEITVVAMIDMNFSFLINLIKTTKIYDELVGGIGMLLKMYPEKFTNYLEKCSVSDKRIKKIILKDIVPESGHVAKMDRLIKICKNR